MTERAGGRLAEALSRKSNAAASRGSQGAAAAPGQAGPRRSVARRNREKVGKRRNPEYKQSLAYVRETVHEAVMDRGLKDK